MKMRGRDHDYWGFLWALLGGLSFIALIMYILSLWASLPVVTYSHSTGECVSVSDLDGIFSCENLPKKYESRWAE